MHVHTSEREVAVHTLGGLKTSISRCIRSLDHLHVRFAANPKHRQQQPPPTVCGCVTEHGRPAAHAGVTHLNHACCCNKMVAWRCVRACVCVCVCAGERKREGGGNFAQFENQRPTQTPLSQGETCDSKSVQTKSPSPPPSSCAGEGDAPPPSSAVLLPVPSPPPPPPCNAPSSSSSSSSANHGCPP